MPSAMLKKKDSLQQVVIDLQSKKADITKRFQDTQAARSTAKRTTDRAFVQMQDAKRRYEASLKEEKDLMMNEETMKDDLQKIGEDIYLTSLELTNALYEERNQVTTDKAKHAKEKKQESQLLSKITKKLPEELVQVIREFLPLSVYIKLMENPSRKNSSRKSYKTSALLRKMHGKVAHKFLTKICTNPLFLSFMTRKDATREVPFIQANETIANPDYDPFWETYSASENRTKLTYVLNIVGEGNPAFALEIIKWIHILYNPLKKYKINYDYVNQFYLRDLTMNDVDRFALPDV
uniref:Uncharacterized protein n=1 Tax=viral metagenome TaxID=1070528 RepID=A0A6C0E0K2_9ZZZZ